MALTWLLRTLTSLHLSLTVFPLLTRDAAVSAPLVLIAPLVGLGLRIHDTSVDT